MTDLTVEGSTGAYAEIEIDSAHLSLSISVDETENYGDAPCDPKSSFSV